MNQKTQKAWFEKIYPNFPGAQLACTDTDSFLFSVKSENIYEDLKKIENFWDFSTLPKDHKHHNAETANKLGLFKLETGADKIFACAGMVFSLYKIKNYKSKKLTLFIFTACRPKVYSVDTIPWEYWKNYETGKEPIPCMYNVKKCALKKMKGVKKHLVRQGFTHRCYVRAILYGKPRYVTYFSINSLNHKVGTFKKRKLGLSGKTHFLFSYINRNVCFTKNTFLYF